MAILSVAVEETFEEDRLEVVEGQEACVVEAAPGVGVLPEDEAEPVVAVENVRGVQDPQCPMKSSKCHIQRQR